MSFAACASMILSYLNARHEYDGLIRLLRIRPALGTEFSAIHRLSRIGVRVIHRERGSLEALYRLLAADWPIIKRSPLMLFA